MDLAQQALTVSVGWRRKRKTKNSYFARERSNRSASELDGIRRQAYCRRGSPLRIGIRRHDDEQLFVQNERFDLFGNASRQEERN